MSQPAPHLPEPFRSAVRLFEVAREVVDASSSWVKGDPRIYELLAPAGQFEPGMVALYRHHCLEIIVRLETGKPIRPATDAEVATRLARLPVKTERSALLLAEIIDVAAGRRPVVSPSFREQLERERGRTPRWRG